MKGIDISMHNTNIDFNAVKQSGIETIIIKATEGVSYIDPKFESHYANAQNKGFNIGFYHFMSEKTSPYSQADDFFNAIKNKTYNVLPCLDIESNNQNRSASVITDRCIEFLQRFKELSGYDCMIYTGGCFGRDLLDSRIKGYPAWIAHYGVNTPMATGFSNVVGHQYTETGSVNGISGNVDMNNFTEGILIGKAAVVNTTQNTSSFNQTIHDFQHQYNLTYSANIKEDGIYGPETQKAINHCLIIKGMNNSLVGFIQCRVGASLDYIFGSETFTKLKQYQKNNSLVDDGKAGPKTFTKLLGL